VSLVSDKNTHGNSASTPGAFPAAATRRWAKPSFSGSGAHVTLDVGEVCVRSLWTQTARGQGRCSHARQGWYHGALASRGRRRHGLHLALVRPHPTYGSGHCSAGVWRCDRQFQSPGNFSAKANQTRGVTSAGSIAVRFESWSKWTWCLWRINDQGGLAERSRSAALPSAPR
jgi:hypothetical protein